MAAMTAYRSSVGHLAHALLMSASLGGLFNTYTRDVICVMVIVFQATDLVKWLVRETFLDSDIYVTRIVSCCHSVVLAILSYLYLSGGDTYNHLSYDMSYIPVGYCLADMINILSSSESFQDTGLEVYIHHGLFMYFASMWTHRVPTIMATGLLAEISNLPLYISFILHKTGMKREYPWAFSISGILTVVTYFIFRVANFTRVMWILSRDTNVDSWPPMLGFMTLAAFNYYWFYRIIQVFRKAIKS